MIWKLLPDRCSHWSLVCSLGRQGNHWRTSSALRGLCTALQANSFLMTAYDWTPSGSPKLTAYPSCFIPSIVATQAFRWSSDPQADSASAVCTHGILLPRPSSDGWLSHSCSCWNSFVATPRKTAPLLPQLSLHTSSPHFVFLHGTITNYYLINYFLIFVSSMRISSSREVGLCPGPSETDKEWYIIVKQFDLCFLVFYILFCPRWKLGPSHDFSLYS